MRPSLQCYAHAMTTLEKSRALWIGGGLAGALVGYVVSKGNSPDRAKIFTRTALSAALGSVVIGAWGDAVLEQENRTGKLALFPLRGLR